MQPVMFYDYLEDLTKIYTNLLFERVALLMILLSVVTGF